MTGELKWSGKVHPVADLFPMMTDEELNDLGADIKANGLLHSIVLDDNGDLIDGRNRMEGCRRGEVLPTFARLPESADPVAFILSANVARRHLSKGQQAMAVARARRCLETKQSVRVAGKASHISPARVSQADTVIDYAPDLSDSVLLGSVSLDSAYDEARQRKEEARIRREAAETENEKLLRLQKSYPDLADMVKEERLTMGEALAAVEARKAEERQRVEKERQRIELMTRSFARCLRELNPPEKMEPRALAADWLNADSESLGECDDLSAARARRCAATLTLYADLKEQTENA
jgi:hypothetical protein